MFPVLLMTFFVFFFSSEQTIGAKAAAALDKELMSTGGFSIDQLMELAGLSVSQAGRLKVIRCLFVSCPFSPFPLPNSK